MKFLQNKAEPKKLKKKIIMICIILLLKNSLIKKIEISDELSQAFKAKRMERRNHNEPVSAIQKKSKGKNLKKST